MSNHIPVPNTSSAIFNPSFIIAFLFLLSADSLRVAADRHRELPSMENAGVVYLVLAFSFVILPEAVVRERTALSVRFTVMGHAFCNTCSPPPPTFKLIDAKANFSSSSFANLVIVPSSRVQISRDDSYVKIIKSMYMDEQRVDINVSQGLFLNSAPSSRSTGSMVLYSISRGPKKTSLHDHHVYYKRIFGVSSSNNYEGLYANYP